MRTRIFRGATALAVLLAGASVASAFPIVNKVQTTNTGPGQNGRVTVKSLTEDAFLINQNNNTALNNASTSARQFSTTTTAGATDQGGNTYAQYTPGRNYTTFCIEVTEFLTTSSVTTVIDKIPPGTANPNQVPFDQVTPSVASMQRAAWIIQNASTIATGTGAQIAAGIQLAVWEIVYDAGTDFQGNVNSLRSITIGSETFDGGFKVESGFSTQAINNANALLAASWNGTPGDVKKFGALGFYQNSTLDANGNTFKLANGQNLITAVPEPSTFAVAGLSTLALLGLGLRRRKMARA